jgi:hypothetical protein
MMRKTLSILALGLLAGCAHYEKLNTTSFTQTASGFEFRAVANPEHPLDDQAAEGWRMNFLENYLEEKHLCPDGYSIRERVPTLTDRSTDGDSYDIRYEGACR